MATERQSITVVTTMRNEGPFVLEWIAHHKTIGVTGFLIFSNDCDDGTDALLDSLAAAGEVVHQRQTKGQKSIQWQALRAAEAHPLVQASDWVTVIDCDEFVNLRAPLGTLGDLIGSAPEADAFVLPWRLFGHDGHLGFTEDPVAERFSMAMPEDIVFPAAGRFFKSLCRWRGGPFSKLGVHRPRTRGAQRGRTCWVDGSGQRLAPDFAADDGRILLMTPRVETARVQLNHYSLRSVEDFMVKRQRGLPNRQGKALDAGYWAERNFNTVPDTSITRHGPETRAEMGRLLDLPDVSERHGEAVGRYREAIARLLAGPDEAALFGRLCLLQTSVVPSRPDADRILSLVHRAQLIARSG